MVLAHLWNPAGSWQECVSSHLAPDPAAQPAAPAAQQQPLLPPAPPLPVPSLPARTPAVSARPSADLWQTHAHGHHQMGVDAIRQSWWFHTSGLVLIRHLRPAKKTQILLNNSSIVCCNVRTRQVVSLGSGLSQPVIL